MTLAYIEDADMALYCGDALEVLRELPNESAERNRTADRGGTRKTSYLQGLRHLPAARCAELAA